jgi:hypothetical protein
MVIGSILFLLMMFASPYYVVRGNELTFEPSGGDIVDHSTAFSSVFVHYENGTIGNVSFRHGIRLRSLANQTPDNLTISAELYQNGQIINTKFVSLSNYRGTTTSIWTPITYVQFEDIHDYSADYWLRCWSNVTTDSETSTTYREANYSIMKTIYVNNITKTNNGRDEFITLELIVYSEMNDISLTAHSEVISNRIIEIDYLLPGRYSYTFYVDQSLFSDFNSDVGYGFKFSITGRDNWTNSNLYYYHNDYRITLHALNSSSQDSDVHYYVLGLTVLVIIILIGGYRITK